MTIESTQPTPGNQGPTPDEAADHAQVAGWLSYQSAKRIVVLIVGITVLLLGAVLLVLPGPGIVVIIFGLSILATEFVWARAWLTKLKAKAKSVADDVRQLAKKS